MEKMGTHEARAKVTEQTGQEPGESAGLGDGVGVHVCLSVCELAKSE